MCARAPSPHWPSWPLSSGRIFPGAGRAPLFAAKALLVWPLARPLARQIARRRPNPRSWPQTRPVESSLRVLPVEWARVSAASGSSASCIRLGRQHWWKHDKEIMMMICLRRQGRPSRPGRLKLAAAQAGGQLATEPVSRRPSKVSWRARQRGFAAVSLQVATQPAACSLQVLGLRTRSRADGKGWLGSLAPASLMKIDGDIICIRAPGQCRFGDNEASLAALARLPRQSDRGGRLSEPAWQSDRSARPAGRAVERASELASGSIIAALPLPLPRTKASWLAGWPPDEGRRPLTAGARLRPTGGRLWALCGRRVSPERRRRRCSPAAH